MIIKIKKLNEKAKIPTYAKEGDAGLDLTSTETKTLKPGERHAFSTGIAMEIPKAHAGLIWPRSGLSVKKGIDVLAGVIDSTYRGEIKVVLLNTSKEEVTIKEGERIAQIIIQQVINAKIKETNSLTRTERGEKGFGSTG